MKNLKPLIISLILILSYSIVFAQKEELTIKFSRDWGYSSGTGKIQGLFSMTVTSTVPLDKVVFYIDQTIIGTSDREPYKLQFNTDDYPNGIHSIYAIGTTKDGKELRTKEMTSEFVTAQEGTKAALSIVLPILGLVLIIVVITAIVPAISGRRNGQMRPGEARNYGIAGGTICVKCKRPFPRHFLSPNMFLGKLERCPHCGKWSITRAYPIEQLREAELSESENQKPSNKKISRDDITFELDDTKFQGL